MGLVRGKKFEPDDACEDKCGKEQLRVGRYRFTPVIDKPEDKNDTPGSSDYPIEGETHFCTTYKIQRRPKKNR